MKGSGSGNGDGSGNGYGYGNGNGYDHATHRYRVEHDGNQCFLQRRRQRHDQPDGQRRYAGLYLRLVQ